MPAGASMRCGPRKRSCRPVMWGGRFSTSVDARWCSGHRGAVADPDGRASDGRHASSLAVHPVRLTMRHTSTRWNGLSAYCGTVCARRSARASTSADDGSSRCSRSARTHHNLDQSSASQHSMSSEPRGSAARLSSRCSLDEALGLTRSIGAPTCPCPVAHGVHDWLPELRGQSTGTGASVPHVGSANNHVFLNAAAVALTR